MFYVSFTNEKGDMEDLSFEERATLTPLWKDEVLKFQEFLERTPELHFLRGKKFFICDETIDTLRGCPAFKPTMLTIPSGT